MGEHSEPCDPWHEPQWVFTSVARLFNAGKLLLWGNTYRSWVDISNFLQAVPETYKVVHVIRIGPNDT
jgi:hypothetical protein